MKIILTIFLFISTILSAQISEITKFTLQDSTIRNSTGITIDDGNNAILFVWSEGDSTYIAESIDGGITWNDKQILFSNSERYFRTVTTNSGRIILAFNNSITSRYCWSDDNGATWSEVKEFNVGKYFNLSVGADNKIWAVYNPDDSKKLVYKTSTDDGETWSEAVELWNDSSIYHKMGSLFQINDSTLLSVAFVEFDSLLSQQNILVKKSYDNGNSWGNYSNIYTSSVRVTLAEAVQLSSNNIKIVLDSYKVIHEGSSDEYIYKAISYIESNDSGDSWSDELPFTKYLGRNFYPNVTSVNGKAMVVFASYRLLPLYQLWYGILGESDDTVAPPIVWHRSSVPVTPLEGDEITIRATVFDERGFSKVFVTYTLNGTLMDDIEMFDDGLHNDLAANDSTFGAIVGTFSANDTLEYFVTAIDSSNYTDISSSIMIVVQSSYKMNEYYLDINRFKLPIDNKGILADVRVGDNLSQGRYDEKNVLFSGGFGLSGLVNNEIWSCANLTASRIVDFVPGPVGSEEDDTLNTIYLLRSDDKPFGNAWQSWRTAVELGAKFYDGNGDGVYNPIDLNGNGLWDANEDRPDLIGDITTWTIFNDGVPTEFRRFDISPKQIEIKQTVFAYSPDTYPELDGVVFIRYNIENKSTEEYDSLYFSFMSDPDIGIYSNDLVGCDTTLNSGFAYDNEVDDDFGNSPTVLSTILQGAPTYIAGETYIDNNSNGIYDDGIDTPIDTAQTHNGKFINSEKYVGAKNLGTNSFVHYMSSHPTQGDADNAEQLRNYLKGFNQQGELIDPCTWEYGSVFEEDCKTINSHFMYSGNPVNNRGWINTSRQDQRMLVNSGPFTLLPNKPVEIIVAYVVGRGNTSLESVDITKEIANNAIGFYNTNFTYVPVGVRENTTTQLPTEYTLSQNYPNPFNPSTTIKYSVPTNVNRKSSIVSLKVYDILGREVATLVKKEQKAGNYEVNFDASSLTSGVYFYSLQAGSFNQSKKMVLLK